MPLAASALVATIGDASAFRSGRILAAFLGLVPRQSSSGGKEKLGKISKRGDAYLRWLLVAGAMVVVRYICNGMELVDYGRFNCWRGGLAKLQLSRWRTRWRGRPGPLWCLEKRLGNQKYSHHKVCGERACRKGWKGQLSNHA